MVISESSKQWGDVGVWGRLWRAYGKWCPGKPSSEQCCDEQLCTDDRRLFATCHTVRYVVSTRFRLLVLGVFV